MSNAIQLHKTEELARDVSTELVFTPEQEKLIRDSFLNGATEQEAQMLMEIARARKLSPFLRQIHFVKRWDNSRGAHVWAAQVGIDGFRTIAERTGKYDGQDEPEYGPPNKDGYPEWARVRAYRKDWSRPSVGVAYWSEFVQTTKTGITHMWRQMPRVMLAKVAESIALRKAFPEDLSGLYTSEEMAQADNEEPARRHQPVSVRVEQATEAPQVEVTEQESPRPDPEWLTTLLAKFDEVSTPEELKAAQEAAQARRSDIVGPMRARVVEAGSKARERVTATAAQ